MISKFFATAMLGTALVSGAAYAQTPPAATTPSSDRASAAAVGAAAELKDTWRASKLVGLAVYNDANEKLGDINEVLVDKSGKINAVIVGIGGFLGVGEHNIAVNFSQLKWVNEPVRASTASTDRTSATPGMSSSSTGTSSGATTGSTSGGTTGSGMTGSSSGSMSTQTSSSSRDIWYPDHAVLSGTKEQLKAQPAFNYSDYNK